MKYKAHIPTEQYGFVEVEFDKIEDYEKEYLAVNQIHKAIKEKIKQIEENQAPF